jgi:hypothetical protein
MNKEMEIVSWREMKKGESLQGFFSLALPSGLRLIDLTYHKRKDGARWVGMPARAYQKSAGSTSWVAMIDFADNDARTRFTKQALQALDTYLAQSATTKSCVTEPVVEQSPF